MTAEQGEAGRGRLVALVVAIVVAAALVAVALLTSGGSSSSGLTIELEPVPDTPNAQLTVYVNDPGENVPATAGGKPNVRLECLDAAGEVVVSTTHPWPFTDTDDGTLDAHVHERAVGAEANRVSRCRLGGTDPVLEGRVGAGR